MQMQNAIEPVSEGKSLSERAGTIEVASSRAAQEVQAAMIIAKRFPRNTEAAFTRIMEACKRKSLAENAIYAYPRGGIEVTGPSIRLAEVLAQNWGNLDFGIIELEQRNGESTVMAYAWDLETNTRESKVFQVAHKRDTKGGSYAVTDSRDIYELVANQGARRLRACILGVIPGDIVEAAKESCEKTLASSSAGPLIDRVRKMASAFSELAVTVEMLEGRLGHKLDATSEIELVTLRKIYTSLRDNMSSRDDWFGTKKVERATINLDQVAPGKVETHTDVAAAQPSLKPAAPVTPPTKPTEETDEDKEQAIQEAIALAKAQNEAQKAKSQTIPLDAEPKKRGRPAGSKTKLTLAKAGPQDAEGQAMIEVPEERKAETPQPTPKAEEPQPPAKSEEKAAPSEQKTSPDELLETDVVIAKVVYLGNNILKLYTVDEEVYFSNAMVGDPDVQKKFEILAGDRKVIHLFYTVDEKGRCLIRQWSID